VGREGGIARDTERESVRAREEQRETETETEGIKEFFPLSPFLFD